MRFQCDNQIGTASFKDIPWQLVMKAAYSAFVTSDKPIKGSSC